MMKNIILGIDTSNYTTSVAVMTKDGELLANIKRPLLVAEGERGLRQSDAVFSHIKNIPSAMVEAREYIENNRVIAVGVSERPRNQDGSYMPCFLSGVAVSEAISAALCVPLYKFSHHCGHIMAAVYSSGRTDLLDKSFGAFHISGGTTELLKVNGYTSDGFNAELVGGTLDLNAGQIVDRIGVYMGLKFPAGPEMEAFALQNDKKIPKRKISGEGMNINLSGVENIAKKLYDDTKDKALTSAFVFDYLSRAFIVMCEEYRDKFGECPFLFAGGVMSNSIIKNVIKEHYESYFAIPTLSADNAVGIACLTKRALIK